MLLVYKPSDFSTFNDLQDTYSIADHPVYLNYVDFQQAFSFPGHLAPKFSLVTGSNLNQQTQKKLETIFQGFQPFAVTCVRGCCVPVARV